MGVTIPVKKDTATYSFGFVDMDCDVVTIVYLGYSIYYFLFAFILLSRNRHLCQPEFTDVVLVGVFNFQKFIFFKNFAARALFRRVAESIAQVDLKLVFAWALAAVDSRM